MQINFACLQEACNLFLHSINAFNTVFDELPCAQLYLARERGHSETFSSRNKKCIIAIWTLAFLLLNVILKLYKFASSKWYRSGLWDGHKQLSWRRKGSLQRQYFSWHVERNFICHHNILGICSFPIQIFK